MTDATRKPEVPAPKRSASGDEAEAMRAELARLRRDLDQVQREFGETQAARLLEANEQLVLAVMEAETSAETALARLSEMSRVVQRDALTDTPNRALMLDRLETAISMARRHQAHIAVLFIDIDHFKQINDGYSHAIGDEVLRRVARQLELAVRDTDTVSRHSGDEFLVLLTEISKPADASLIAQKILTALVSIRIDGAPGLTVTASVGIALFPENGRSAKRLIDRADAAMYGAKKRGGGIALHYGTDPATDFDETRPFDAHPTGTRPAPLEGELQQARDLRHANEQLVLSSLAAQEMEAKASSAHRQQVKLLAMVVHELRNPLAPIRNAAEMLNKARSDETQHRWLQEMIKRQVGHLSRIVDDLLDGSRVDTGKFHLEYSNVDLLDVLSLAVESCRPAMEAKQQEMSVTLPVGPMPVHGDPVRLAQVFRNLLDNAAKYTGAQGRIALNAQLLDHCFVITVSDNGIGIVADALPHVFDLFVQDPRAVAVHSGGLGIGLAIVRELVEAHGGEVNARSAGHGMGSEFIVSLPMAADEASPD